jgi:hypothetical protein
MQNLHSSARTAAKTMFKRWASLRQAKIATILMLAAVCLSSCSDYVVETNEKDKNTKRIIGKGTCLYNGREYQIIEVDSVEYLSNYNGGICPLVKK